MAGGAEGMEMLRLRLAQLQQEMAARERLAHEAGFREGEAAAQGRIAPQAEEMLARLAASVDELMAGHQQMRRRLEEDLVKLSTIIARRILHRELTVDPEALLGIVRAALEKTRARDVFRLRVYPREVALLDNYLAALNLPQRIEVVADPMLERGAVVFETERGDLDGSIETQLEEIDRGFADLMRRRP